MKENRENHVLKTMGPKRWVQKDEPKTANVGYSRSFMKSLFYFILFGYLVLQFYIYSFAWKKNRESRELWD